MVHCRVQNKDRRIHLVHFLPAVDPVDFTTPVSDLTMGPLIPGVAQVDLDSGVDVAANIISLVFL